MKRIAVALAMAVALAGCSVPHERDDATMRKQAISDREVAQVFDRYHSVRAAAIELLDPKPLSIVERGSVLDIDSGSFEVAQSKSATRPGDDTSVIDDVVAPSFSKYPLWFVAVVRDRQTEVRRIQVFERETPVDPWLLVLSPEMQASASVPTLRDATSAGKLLIKPTSAKGLALSPQDAVAAYAAAIPAAPDSPAAKAVESDAFMKQMRETAAKNAGLTGVQFSQTWTAQPVRYAMRLANGGALVFGELERIDTYTVPEGQQVTFGEGTPESVLMGGSIQGTGALRYVHEVLMIVSPNKGTPPKVIGQYGGVVAVVSN